MSIQAELHHVWNFIEYPSPSQLPHNPLIDLIFVPVVWEWKSLQQEALGEAESSAQDLKKKFAQLEGKVSELEKELAKTKEQNNSCNIEIMCYKELIK